jgi:subfamily B ATP-binding cassette protein HlyB/CyaB
VDTGLHCLVALARHHQLPAEVDQLTHQFLGPGELFGNTELLLAAKALTLKGKIITPKVSGLSNDILPTIAKATDGTYFILARVENVQNSQAKISSSTQQDTEIPTNLLIHNITKQAPEIITLDAFEALWSGEIIALTRRQGLGVTLQAKFDISWFIPSLVKYRKLFFEVVVISFFLQMFALVTPLFSKW